MVEFGEIKMRVESGSMGYDELLPIWESYVTRLDMMEWCPERYDRESEFRSIEDWMLELRIPKMVESNFFMED